MNLALVLCAPRTGSTLLTRILDSHSQIAAPFEIGIPKVFKGDRKEKKVREKEKEICSHYGLSHMRARLDYRYILKGILQAEGKELLVVKDPRHALFVDRLWKGLGDVPIILLVRDIRACSMSVMFKGNYEVGMRIWHSYYQAIESHINRYSKVFRLRYEDLTSAPAKHVQDVVNFLGEDFETGMVEYWKHAHTDERLNLWDGKKPSDSIYQRDLEQKTISSSRPRIPEKVEQIYRRHPEFVEMNVRLGYGDSDS